MSTKNEQLIVDNGEVFSFPIEDIRCVLIEDNRSTLSTSLISKFAEVGVTVLICNEKHIPTAAISPINCYSRQLKQVNLQIVASLPFKKRLWQQIVRIKIINQSRCLEIFGMDGVEELRIMLIVLNPVILQTLKVGLLRFIFENYLEIALGAQRKHR